MVPAELDAVPSAQTHALVTLRNWIVEGELPGGSRIAELPLVQRLGVSRTPVRAALQRLAQEGLLQPLPNGGYVVRQFTLSDIADTIALRGVLEGTAARWAAERGVGQVLLNQAKACLAALDEVLRVADLDDDQWLRYSQLNERFHELLLDMAASSALRLEWRNLAQLPFAGPSSFVLGQAASLEQRQRFGIAQDQHWQVLAAIDARQGSRAEHLMREHAQIAQRNLHESLAQRSPGSDHARQVARLLGATLESAQPDQPRR